MVTVLPASAVPVIVSVASFVTPLSATDPVTGDLLSSNSLGVFANAGPGIRLVLCKKVDFGIGTSFHLTNDSYIGHAVRAEFRWRF